jgi:phosphate/sulfate permease
MSGIVIAIILTAVMVNFTTSSDDTAGVMATFIAAGTQRPRGAATTATSWGNR